MNVKKININQSEQTYYIASDIYDVSYHNNGTTFESLSALLNNSNLSTLIPSAIRCGGMTVRFVQSSDNKYVQARCMAQNFTTDVTQWQEVDDEPTAGSDNLVKSGGIYNFAGAFDISHYNKSSGILATYPTLSDALSAVPLSKQRGGMSIKYIDLSSGKYVEWRLRKTIWSTNVSDWVFCENIKIISDNDKILVEIDKNSKIYKFIDKNGIQHYCLPLHIHEDVNISDIECLRKVNDTQFIEATIDRDEKIIYALTKKGDFYIGGNILNKQFEDVLQKTTPEYIKSIAFPIDEVDLTAEIPSTPNVVCPTYLGAASIFQSWGFIGDSLASGVCEYLEESVVKGENLYEYSWGQQMCKILGSSGYNFSLGGTTSKNWCNNNGGFESVNRSWKDAMLTENLKQAYIIAYGINDLSKMESYNISITDDIDLSDYNNNQDSFAGWYAGIIQRIQSVQPRARIFCVTMPDGEDEEKTQAFNNVIRAMGTLFSNVFIIDMWNYGPVYRFNGRLYKRMHLGTHLSPYGYLYTAWLFLSYIDWIIRNNLDSFKDICWIGTNKYR